MTKEEIQHLATLARIDITDEEMVALAKEFDAILGYVEQLEEIVQDEKREKTVGVHFNEFREDGEPHEGGIYSEKLLASAPKRDGAYLKVKKVLDHG